MAEADAAQLDKDTIKLQVADARWHIDQGRAGEPDHELGVPNRLAAQRPDDRQVMPADLPAGDVEHRVAQGPPVDRHTVEQIRGGDHK